MPRHLALICLVLVLVLGACSTTRHLPEGGMLLRRVSIELDSVVYDLPPSGDLISYVGQRPNRKFLGVFDLALGMYSMSDLESRSWMSRKLRQWGETPVVFSPHEAESSISSLSSAMYNKGFLRATTTLRLDTVAPRKVDATYLIQLGPRYRITRHEQHILSDAIRSTLHPDDTIVAKRQYLTEQYRSLLDSGATLSAETLQAERRRITHILRNRGYWDFREERIRFEVDTLGGYNDAWVYTRIDSVSPVYRIGRVQMRHAIPSGLSSGIDTTLVGGVEILRGRTHRLRPHLLAVRNQIQPGGLYSQDALSHTYSLLSDLGPIRQVSVNIRRDSTQSTPTLDVEIATTPERSMELETDIVGTNSGGNFGVNTSLGFVHHNIFGSAEQLRLRGRVGYEELGGLRSNHLSYGIEASLAMPKLIVPFLSLSQQRPLRAHTAISLSYDYLTRPEFRRELLSASWSYSWASLSRPAIRYAYKMAEVDYMRFADMDLSFLGSIPEYIRLLTYRNQFVVSNSFMLSINTALDPRLRSASWIHNLRLYVQSAGNLLYGVSSLLGAERDELGRYALLGTHYAQFVRAEVDYSGLHRLDEHNALAYHAGLSAIVPYGNSEILPIDLRYFSGGSNSVRGWGVRELGPGSMPRSAGRSIFHQVGDLKVDLNLEYRARFARSWELATFVDAGNVWTIRSYDTQPGGAFRWGSALSELAWSTGVGLRWDFDYFLLRFDAGFKLYNPQLPEGSRWMPGRATLTEMTALHIALGYPF